jgi:hypothetical protein
VVLGLVPFLEKTIVRERVGDELDSVFCCAIRRFLDFLGPVLVADPLLAEDRVKGLALVGSHKGPVLDQGLPYFWKNGPH